MALSNLLPLPNSVKFVLDSPSNDTVCAPVFWVRGWATEESDKISLVSIYLSDKKIAETNKKIKRPDVQKAFRYVKNSINSGFEFFVENIIPGTYILKITLTITGKEYLALERKLKVLQKMTLKQVSEKMKNDWDGRAKEDAEKYIYGRGDIISGEDYDYAEKIQPQLVVNLLQKLFSSENFSKQKMLDLGCGVGRMGKGFSDIFAHYIGIDVSKDMIKIAKERLKNKKNVELFTNNGYSLEQINSDFLDFVFEGYVFQHIPQKDIIENYCKESYRILKNNGHIMALFWRTTLLDKDLNIRDKQLYSGKSYDITNDTMRGVMFEQDEIATILKKIGFVDLHFFPEHPLSVKAHHLVVATKSQSNLAN